MNFLVILCFGLSVLSVLAQPLIVLAPLEADFLSESPSKDPDLMLLYKVLNHYPGKVSIVEMSWSRAEIEVIHRPDSCVPVRKTAQRESYMNFSLPYKVLSAPKLVIRKDSLYRAMIEQMYQQHGLVSLADLLSADVRPILGVDQTRSYGREIDGLIQRYKNSTSIYVKANVMKVAAGSIPMLLKGHVDMVVEYQMSIADHSQIITFPLSETGRFVPLYFGCSKSTHGVQQMAVINQTIRDLSGNKDYQQLMLTVLEPDDHDYAIAHWHALLSL